MAVPIKSRKRGGRRIEQSADAFGFLRLVSLTECAS
jgi:hypothetical protein